MPKRFLGLQVFRDPLTDEQYVERIRKSLLLQRRLRYLYGVLGLAMIAVCAWGISVFVRILTMPGAPPGQQSLVYLVFTLAIILGLSIGFWLSKAAHHIATSFFEERKDRLLIESWDAMHQLLVERDERNEP